MLRVLLAEDMTIVRQGLVALLSYEGDLTVVADAGEGGLRRGLHRTLSVPGPDRRLRRAAGVLAARRHTDRALRRRPVVIGGWTRIPDAGPLVDGLSRLPGAAAIVPELSFPAAVVTASGQLLTGPQGGPSLGHSWSSAVLAPFRLIAGRAPAGPDEVVLDDATAARAGVAVGATVRLATVEAPRPYTVTGLVAARLGSRCCSSAPSRPPGSRAHVPARTRSASPRATGPTRGRWPRWPGRPSPRPSRRTTAPWSRPRVSTGERRGEQEFAGAPGPGDGPSSLAGTVGVLSLLG